MKKLLFFFASILLLLNSFALTKADTISDKTKQIEELEAKVNSLKAQANTLAGQVAYYDTQIQLSALKISQTEDLVATISGKINSLESALDTRSKILEHQIAQAYRQGSISPFQVLFSTQDFSQTLSQYKYLQTLQAYNRKFLHDTQLAQSNYAAQRKLLEESKSRLETQKNQLTTLKSQKDSLLKQTKNDEATYQKQLESAKLELQALESAIALGKSEGPVKKGDSIALYGNSGYPSCSTGAHLHFEVRQNDNWVNAENYLKHINDKWGLSIGSGSWDWPLKGSVEVTQRYGITPYSYRYTYSGGQHTGVDMVSNEKIIYAPADGTLYSYTGKCGSSNLNIKYIDHGSGLKTFYLHVQ